MIGARPGPRGRRLVLGRVTRAMARLQPLAPPPLWQAMVTARSLAGAGPLIAPPPIGRSLVLAPHPDDETIGCGATAALGARIEEPPAVVVVTDGEASVAMPGLGASATAALRRQEAAAACACLGLGAPHSLGLPDGSLAVMLDELTAILADTIAHLRPELIFAPWVLDAHPDHRAVAVALGRALHKLGNAVRPEVWGYEVWGALPPNRLVDVSAVWSRKTAALAQHRSSRASFDLDAHLALARWRSIFGMGGAGYAEAFFVLDAPTYAELVVASVDAMAVAGPTMPGAMAHATEDL